MNNSDMPAHANEMQLDDAVSLGCECTVRGLAEFHSGISKREYFAGLAMQGLMSNGYIDPEIWGAKRIADLSLQSADALLNELEKTK